ncbi:MAG TPA: type II toxin-antitoxin system PemK/MazF family toxin [Thermoanaerobaculia bacterium]|nr:type II toxin-antitoxin system PemK/MazF family toxin [Thermoanaerobaculia bacterium]
MIRQGDVYWYDFGEPSGSGPGFRRPCVVVQNDTFNESRMNTVVVCALTTNLRRARVPGNVLLEEGEADLAERSVLNVSQLFTVDKEDLLDKIGTLSPERVQQAFEGIYQLLKPEGYPL